MRFLFIGSLSVFFTLQLNAAQSLSTKITHHYDSMRAMGMGNAFTAVADDYSLIFYNPAGFAKKKTNEVQFTLAGAGTSPKTTKFVDDIKKASDTQGTDPEKAQAISNTLEEYYGKSLGGRLQALEMFWIRKNWGVALIPADLTVDISIDRQLGPAIDLNIKGDTTLAYGYGTEVSKYLSVGATAKVVHRVAVEQSVSALELATNSDLLSSKRFKEGNLVDFDLGVMWTPNWFGHTVVKEEKPDGLKVESKLPPAADEKKEEKREPQAENEVEKAEKEIAENADKKDEKPLIKETLKEKLPLTLGLVVHNVLGGSFSKSKIVNKDATETPTKMYRVIDVGSQYVLGELGDLTIRSMVDFRDILHPEVNFNKSFHAGVELDYSPSGWFKSQLRGGVNQMYYTAGATFLLGVLNIDVLSYGEEVGTTSKKIENRVYAAKVGFNF